MHDLLDNAMAIFPRDGWQRLMMDAIWQSTLIGVGISWIARALANRSAARAWILFIGIIACVVAPTASLVSRHAGWSLPLWTRSMATERSAIASMNAASMEQGRDPNPSTPRDHAWATHSAPTNPVSGHQDAHRTAGHDYFSMMPSAWLVNILLTGIAIAWISSSLLLSGRMITAWVAVRRLIKHACVCEDMDLLEATSEAAKRLELKRVPLVLKSEQIATPMVVAFFRPVLLIPHSTNQDARENNWNAVVTHELAHIRRHDGWTKLGVQVASMLLPLQPLLWRMRQGFFQACEEACDDWAVATGHDPLDLATVLTNWAGLSRSRPELMLAVGMSTSRSRILRLIAMNESPSAAIPRRYQIGSLVAVMLVCCGIALAQPLPSADPPQETAPAVATQPTNDNRVSLASAKMTISGTCVDEHSRPVPNAVVRLFHYGPNTADVHSVKQTELQSVQCDDDGHFELKEVARGESEYGLWHVVAQHPGMATRAVLIQAEKFGDQNVRLQFAPAATLRGRVVNEEGKPVAGAIVSAGSPLIEPVVGIGTAVSDAEGHYIIDDLHKFSLADQKPPFIGDGSSIMLSGYLANVQHADYARDRFSVPSIPGEMDVIVRRPATVEGTIILAESGQPAAGARLEFSSDAIAPDSWTRTTTNDMGQYRIDDLPPGDFRLDITTEGQPLLHVPNLTLSAGNNHHDFQIEPGVTVKGRVVDVTTEQTIRLKEGEIMSISKCTPEGRSEGPTATIEPDGTFTLILRPGRHHFGMYFGKNWLGVNTDQLIEKGVDIAAGQTAELEIRVRARNLASQQPPRLLSPEDKVQLTEQAAVAAIKQLGGWIEKEKIDGVEHVVEVNMVYHDDAKLGRLDNHILSDEALSYAPKFPCLKLLALHSAQATDQGLANLRGMSSLESIFLWDASSVSDVGAAHLATLQTLKVIHINDAKLTDEALRLFSKLPNVERLSLQGNQFTNRGLEHIQSMTQLKELVLGLGNNQITDDGLRYVAGLTKLERLCLQKTQITDIGLQHLTGLKQLQDLWVNHTAVTYKGLAELRETLPHLK